MNLPAGTRLGPYEIQAPLGAGGMGEVYRARDPRLDRDVAVKVLPSSVAADPERLRRFELEARAAGSLDHPNILAVHDVGWHDGVSYVVSELLEGATLRARFGGAALPPRKAIDYATQIARGLAAAHEKGIVHRDLKPENVFVTRDGRVKILDFGLAKLAPLPEGAAEITKGPTLTQDTGPGTVLGTAGYMSPEQVRGRPVDHRSDVFSFGAILYEMVTGRRAFKGDTAADTVIAILKEDPPLDSGSTPGLSPALERIVRHCLEKQADERFQSTRDLVFDLEALSAGSGMSMPQPVGRGRPRLRPVPALALLSLALAALLPLAYFWGRRAGELPDLRRLTFRRGTITSARFAPDGQTIVYGAEWEGAPVELYSSRAEGPESRHLGMPSADILAISSSGEMALSIGRRITLGWQTIGTLARAPLSGGAPREVLENVHEADWSPDGSDLAVVRGFEGKMRLEFPLGTVLYETPGNISHARFSPKGDLIAFLDHPLRADSAGSVAVVDRAGGKRTLSPHFGGTQGLTWSPDGEEIWFSAGDLQAVTLTGSVRSILTLPGGTAVQDVSRDGRVLLAHNNWRREIMGLPPGEAAERNLSWLDWSFPTDISEDGRTLLFEEQGGGIRGDQYDIYLRSTDGGEPVRLGDGRGLALSPDGKWALCATAVTNAQLRLLPTGPGAPRMLDTTPENYGFGGGWFPDGRRVALAISDGGRASRLRVIDVASGTSAAIGPDGITVFGKPVSPDGTLVAALGPDQGILLVPSTDGPPRTLPGQVAGDVPVRWADARSLYVIETGSPGGRIVRLDVVTGRRELWKDLMPADHAGVSAIGPILLSADGKSYVYSYRRLLSDLYLIEGLR